MNSEPLLTRRRRDLVDLFQRPDRPASELCVFSTQSNFTGAGIVAGKTDAAFPE